MTGYEYGNARLRARRAGLLRREQYAGLLGRDLPGLLAALATTAYRAQASGPGGGIGDRGRADGGRADGRRGDGGRGDGGRADGGGADGGAGAGQLRLLWRMAGEHLAGALADVAGLYRDRAAAVVTALLGRFDVDNVLLLLRAAHRGGAPTMTADRLVPVGRLDERTAREAASQPDLPAAARLLASRGLPDPASAASLAAAAHRYEIDADLALVEHAVVSSARAHQLAVLAEARSAAAPAAAALRLETDDANLLLALRLRESANGRADGTTSGAGSPYLPGGTVPDAQLAALQHAPTRADTLAAVARPPAHWSAPLAAWADGGSLAALHADLDTARLRAELGRLRRADPLGAGLVLHHVLAHHAQARNIRLLAQAATGIVGQDEARHHLITPV